jgi:alpha/beta superfamily hydrolase
VTPERLALASADGLTLEGELDRAPDGRACVVVCHPHPRMGGTMNAPLLCALRDELVARRWNVLRFNFRGVGASEGEPSLGEEEVADALGAVRTARATFPGSPHAIVGWSFGGAVAIRTSVVDDSLLGCAAIAPAVARKRDVSVGLPPATELDLGIPLLVVCGARDEVVAPYECRAWIEPIDAATYVEIRGANHFFWGKYGQLATTVADWLEDLL